MRLSDFSRIFLKSVTNIMYHPLKDVHIPVTKTSTLRSQVNLKKVAKKWTKKKIPSEIKSIVSSDNLPPLKMDSK